MHKKEPIKNIESRAFGDREGTLTQGHFKECLLFNSSETIFPTTLIYWYSLFKNTLLLLFLAPPLTLSGTNTHKKNQEQQQKLFSPRGWLTQEYTTHQSYPSSEETTKTTKTTPIV